MLFICSFTHFTHLTHILETGLPDLKESLRDTSHYTTFTPKHLKAPYFYPEHQLYTHTLFTPKHPFSPTYTSKYPFTQNTL